MNPKDLYEIITDAATDKVQRFDDVEGEADYLRTALLHCLDLMSDTQRGKLFEKLELPTPNAGNPLYFDEDGFRAMLKTATSVDIQYEHDFNAQEDFLSLLLVEWPDCYIEFRCYELGAGWKPTSEVATCPLRRLVELQAAWNACNKAVWDPLEIYFSVPEEGEVLIDDMISNEGNVLPEYRDLLGTPRDNT